MVGGKNIMDYLKIGRRIAEKMQNQNVTQQAMADWLKVNRTTVTRYLSGTTQTIPYNVLVSMAKYLDTNPLYLLGWSSKDIAFDNVAFTSDTLGERLKSSREFRNESQTDAANALHVSKQTLYKYEKNIIKSVPMDFIEDAARHYRVSRNALLGVKEDYSKVREDVKTKIPDHHRA